MMRDKEKGKNGTTTWKRGIKRKKAREEQSVTEKKEREREQSDDKRTVYPQANLKPGLNGIVSSHTNPTYNSKLSICP